MAGRYQGYHRFRDKDGEEYGNFEVFWHQIGGWFWRPRSPGFPPEGATAVGPFTTSTEAYQNARSERFIRSPKPHQPLPARQRTSQAG